jgi:hypothetical protein
MIPVTEPLQMCLTPTTTTAITTTQKTATATTTTIINHVFLSEWGQNSWRVYLGWVQGSGGEEITPHKYNSLIFAQLCVVREG